MVCVIIINVVTFSFTHIRCKRLTMIIIRCFVIRRTVLFDILLDKRIRASSVVWRIRQRDNVLIGADGEAFNIAYLIYISSLVSFLGSMAVSSLSTSSENLRENCADGICTIPVRAMIYFFTIIRSLPASLPLVYPEISSLILLRNVCSSSGGSFVSFSTRSSAFTTTGSNPLSSA